MDFANQVSTPARPLTLRQIYYAAATAQLIPATDKSYKRLKSVLTKARRSGAFPYEAMVDGLRAAQRTAKWDSLSDRAATAKFIHLDPWQDQLVIPEIVLEKDAILRLIEDECTAQDVTIRTFRGDPSLSFLYSTAKDYAALLKASFWISVGYLGDHDPGGINICRSAERGVREILKDQFKVDLEDEQYRRAFKWVRLGVNFSDFDNFGLLPIPTKDGSDGKRPDTKLKAYMEEFDVDWGCELDALPLDEIVKRTHDHIEEAKNQERWEETKIRHAEEESRWQEMLENIDAA